MPKVPAFHIGISGAIAGCRPNRLSFPLPALPRDSIWLSGTLMLGRSAWKSASFLGTTTDSPSKPPRNDSAIITSPVYVGVDAKASWVASSRPVRLVAAATTAARLRKARRLKPAPPSLGQPQA